MTKILKIVAITVLLGASASASAWWGGPGSSSFMDDFFGDGNADFNMSMNTSAHGWGRGHSYNAYAPYYGYGPGYGAPYGYAPYAVTPVALQTPVAPTAQNQR